MPTQEAVRREPWLAEWTKNFRTDLTRCSRCLYDETTPAITFDDRGVCNYCKISDDMDRQYPVGDEGEKILQDMAERIRRDGRGRKYDLVVGVSGGCDSSIMIEKAVKLGLRPLAVHFDNTWNTTIAVENVHNVLKALGVELYTLVVDNEEYDDIYRAFLRAGVPDLESPTDIGLAATLYRAAEKFRVRYIFEGHSFRTEGISPLGWLYMDAKYIQSVHRQYGEGRLKTFPNLWFSSQMKWMVLKRIKKLRPLYYMTYNKEATKKYLADTYGWQWYGGHHLENRLTHFYHTYFLPRRFGIDQRVNGYSALMRCGQMEREEALALLAEPPSVDFELVDLFKKRLGLSDEEFEGLMTQPKRTYREFKTYKPLFERLRPFFCVLAKMELVPMSFYLKYTSKSNI